MRHWFCVSLMAILFVGAAQPTASLETSYSARHFKPTWRSVRNFSPKRTLRVYVNTGHKLYKPRYLGYVKQGLSQWFEATGAGFRYQMVDSPRRADITVDWVPAFSEDPAMGGDARSRVGHSKIRIKPVNVPEPDIKINIWHELGHALGINGHSKDRGDIMTGVRRYHRDNPDFEPAMSERDRRAIRRLYSSQWQPGEDLYAQQATDVETARR